MHSPQMNADERSYKYSELTEQIIGVFYEVYNELGFGFLEKVYEDAMAIALKEHGLTVQQQVPVPVWFHGQTIGTYDADLVINGIVLLELKACRALDSSHEAQLLHYLRSTEIEVGLLLKLRPQATGETFCF